MNKDLKLVELRAEINQRIKWLEPRIAQNQEQLKQNFTYYFSWVCEELWKDEFKVAYYRHILVDAYENDIEEVMMKKARQLAKFCTEAYNVRENSTGALHREASTFKFISSLELLEDLNKMLNYNY